MILSRSRAGGCSPAAGLLLHPPSWPVAAQGPCLQLSTAVPALPRCTALRQPAPRRQHHAPAPPPAGVPTRSRCCAHTRMDTLACTRSLSCTSAGLHAPMHAHTCTRAAWQNRRAVGYQGMPAATALAPGPCSGARMRREPGCCGCACPGCALPFLTPSSLSAHMPFPQPQQIHPWGPRGIACPMCCCPAQGRQHRAGGAGGRGAAAAQPASITSLPPWRGCLISVINRGEPAASFPSPPRLGCQLRSSAPAARHDGVTARPMGLLPTQQPESPEPASRAGKRPARRGAQLFLCLLALASSDAHGCYMQAPRLRAAGSAPPRWLMGARALAHPDASSSTASLQRA